MLKQIIAVYVCDSCKREEQRLLGDSGIGINKFTNELDTIMEIIKMTPSQGWVRDYDLNDFCDKCHMKKELKWLKKDH